jgi:hypothetical protein
MSFAAVTSSTTSSVPHPHTRLFISPFGISGVQTTNHEQHIGEPVADDTRPSNESTQGALVQPGEAKSTSSSSSRGGVCSSLDIMMGTAFQAASSTEQRTNAKSSSQTFDPSVGGGSRLVVQSAGGLQAVSDEDEVIRKAEALLPGTAVPKSPPTRTTRASTVGERMLMSSKRRDASSAKGTPKQAAEGGNREPSASEGSGSKDGWGLLSKRFAVSSALSSLNNELKTFGAKPQEAAIDRERTQSKGLVHPCMIVPGSPLHVRYSWANMILLLYCAFSIPIRVSFDFQLSQPVSILEFCIDVFFMADVIINFATGYVQQEGEMITKVT